MGNAGALAEVNGCGEDLVGVVSWRMLKWRSG